MNRAAYQRDWRARRKAGGLEYATDAQKVRNAAWLASTYRAARESLFDILGRVCVGCDHDDPRVLEFDHKDNDGAEDRRRFGGARPFLIYYVGRPDEALAKLQTLCRNCNWLKRRGEPLPKEIIECSKHTPAGLIPRPATTPRRLSLPG